MTTGPANRPRPTPGSLKCQLLTILADTEPAKLFLMLAKHYGASTEQRGHQLRSGHLIIDHPDRFSAELIAAAQDMLVRYSVVHRPPAPSAEAPAA